MTWLNAIENILGAGEGGVNVKSQIRMARVIREQGKIIKVAQAFMISDWDFHEHSCGGFDYHDTLCKLLNNLSPDAKEVINDSTTPRAT